MSGGARPSILRRLVEPGPRLADEGARRDARLLAALTLVHLLFAAFGVGAANLFWALIGSRARLWGPDLLALGLGFLVVAGCYALARSGRLRAALALYLAADVAYCLVAPFVGGPDRQIGLLAATFIPVLVAATLLSERWTVAVATGVLGCAALELALLDGPVGDRWTGVVILLAAAAGSALAVVMRRHLARLRQGEDKLRALINSSRDVIAVFDATGRRTAVYGQPEAVAGFAMDEPDSTAHLSGIHPDDLPRLQREMAELARQPGARRRTGWRHRHRDGSWRWLEVLASNRLDLPGVEGLVFDLRDVSDRQAAEEAVRRSELRYRTLFATVTDAVLLTTRDGRLLEVNDAACRMLGRGREELLRLRLQDLTPPREVPSVEQRHDAIARDGHQMFEALLERKDGTAFPVEVAVSPLALDGATVFLGVARDTSARRAAEQEHRRLSDQLQQAAKMESIGRLAGGVAHDFNNLLTVIQGNLELARLCVAAGKDPAEALGDAREAATCAEALTRQLLAFSRRQAVEPRVVDLNELLARMQRMLARLVGEDVELRSRPRAARAAVYADAGLLEQVVVNLAVNARDAMPRGGELTIETAEVELDEAYRRDHPLVEAGPHVMLAVSDTGTGMSEEVRQHLFEPFFTTKPRGQGTGLGLATSYGIVRQSGGTIEVYSEPGKGTTFKIYLPVAGEAAAREPEAAPREAPRGGTETILLVEDDAAVRELAEDALASRGYRVLAAGSGAQALALAREHRAPIGLLLTDVVMPEMNGRVLAGQLAGLHPEAQVLYTSGYTEEIIGQRGGLSPGQEFLSKPYSIDGLARRVREILDRPPGASPKQASSEAA